MKFVRLNILLVALLPILQAGAMDLAVNGNPYTPIVTRNIFGLVPIPTNVLVVDPASLIPLPKITPNGIMTIFGVKEALYKVAGTPKPGKPAVDQSYTMSEGEGQDDIEVVKIDTQADVITFNNHGKIQELPLVATAASSGSAGPGSSMPSAGAAMGGGRFPRPSGGPGFAGRRGFPVPSTGVTSSENASERFGGAATSGSANNNNSEMDGLSPEAQVLLIEKNRLDHQEDVNNGKLPPFPQTDITPKDSGN